MALSGQGTSLGGIHREFPTTIWSEILGCGHSEQRLESVILRYWKPVYWAIRRHGYSNEDAKDLTQDFMIHLLERGKLQKIGPGGAKLRTYFKTVLRNFLVDYHRHETSLKRGGEAKRLSLDFSPEDAECIPIPRGTTPEEAFDQAWAQEIEIRCLEQLRAHLQSRGKSVYWDVFKAYDLCASAKPPESYATLAKRFEITELDVRNYLSFARTLFSRLLRECAKDTVGPGENVDAEVQDLLGSMNG